jgi:glucose-6-phosphate 1-epimerase
MMSTASNESTKRWWPIDFRAVYRASFGEELRLELEVHNTGSTIMRFEEALHAYCKVSDVRSALVAGLEALHYLDKTASTARKLKPATLPSRQKPTAFISIRSLRLSCWMQHYNVASKSRRKTPGLL